MERLQFVPPSYQCSPVTIQADIIRTGGSTEGGPLTTMPAQTNNTLTICYQPIGIIHSPFHDPEGMPIQPIGALGIRGTVELRREFVAGLRDLEGFSHIFLIYHFHCSMGFSLEVVPFVDHVSHGVFATRAPRRPNSIGISVVRLLSVEGNVLHVENVDIMDGTPLLDIKPFVPSVDNQEVDRIGWLDNGSDKIAQFRADKRFK